MNATARRIDNLFEKSGIVWLFPVISTWAPRGCERKYTDPALLLLIKAVSQEWDWFCFFFFLFFLSLDLFVSRWSKQWWKEMPISLSKQNFSCLFNARLFNAKLSVGTKFYFLLCIVSSSFIQLLSLCRFSRFIT